LTSIVFHLKDPGVKKKKTEIVKPKPKTKTFERRCLKCARLFEPWDVCKNWICGQCDGANKAVRTTKIHSTYLHVDGRRVEMRGDD
jgi:hypothetical protein